MNRTTTPLPVSNSGKVSNILKSSTEQCSFEPSESVIKTILNYSKALQVISSKHVEYVEVLLN